MSDSIGFLVAPAGVVCWVAGWWFYGFVCTYLFPEVRVGFSRKRFATFILGLSAILLLGGLVDVLLYGTERGWEIVAGAVAAILWVLLSPETIRRMDGIPERHEVRPKGDDPEHSLFAAANAMREAGMGDEWVRTFVAPGLPDLPLIQLQPLGASPAKPAPPDRTGQPSPASELPRHHHHAP